MWSKEAVTTGICWIKYQKKDVFARLITVHFYKRINESHWHNRGTYLFETVILHAHQSKIYRFSSRHFEPLHLTVWCRFWKRTQLQNFSFPLLGILNMALFLRPLTMEWSYILTILQPLLLGLQPRTQNFPKRTSCWFPTYPHLFNLPLSVVDLSVVGLHHDSYRCYKSTSSDCHIFSIPIPLDIVTNDSAVLCFILLLVPTFYPLLQLPHLVILPLTMFFKILKDVSVSNNYRLF